jgi:hypothetical protein
MHRQAEKASGGRGKKGGLSEYAEKVGKSKQTIHECRDAAEVASKVSAQADGLLDKAKHLAAIHKLPQDAWPQAVANRKRSEAAKAREREEDGTLKADPVVVQHEQPLVDRAKGRAARAKQASVSTATQARAQCHCQRIKTIPPPPYAQGEAILRGGWTPPR